MDIKDAETQRIRLETVRHVSALESVAQALVVSMYPFISVYVMILVLGVQGAG
jgi:hypothetical protein